MNKNIAIFASGSGSNAEKIITDFAATDLSVKVILCNNPNAFVIERAKKLNVPCVVFGRADFKTEEFIKKLESYDVNYIVLAGFLWKMPAYLIGAYPDRIINLHPALLPKYGGKGMYGSHVHEAVVANKETESGITIHLVNERYDEGRILFQAKCEVPPTEDATAVAAKIHLLEYAHFSNVVKEFIG